MIYRRAPDTPPRIDSHPQDPQQSTESASAPGRVAGEGVVTLDPWQAEILAHRARLGPDASEGRGRVLRVKLGYNPNSSSIGSVVSVLMWTTAFGAIALNVFASLVRREAGLVAGAEGDGAGRGTEGVAGESADAAGESTSGAGDGHGAGGGPR